MGDLLGGEWRRRLATVRLELQRKPAPCKHSRRRRCVREDGARLPPALQQRARSFSLPIFPRDSNFKSPTCEALLLNPRSCESLLLFMDLSRSLRPLDVVLRDPLHARRKGSGGAQVCVGVIAPGVRSDPREQALHRWPRNLRNTRPSERRTARQTLESNFLESASTDLETRCGVEYSR